MNAPIASYDAPHRFELLLPGERALAPLLDVPGVREVTSDSPYGKRRFAVPHHVLRFYFPALWPQAEQDEAAQTMPPPAGSAATSPRRR